RLWVGLLLKRSRKTLNSASCRWTSCAHSQTRFKTMCLRRSPSSRRLAQSRSPVVRRRSESQKRFGVRESYCEPLGKEGLDVCVLKMIETCLAKYSHDKC